MRRTATGLIVLMAALFLWSGRFLEAHPAWGYLHAFAEAAMVGGLADWFAVTALFRRPLGLPIPHTAIIPENKDRIADTMAGFLRENFLTPAVVGRRMGSMNLAHAVGFAARLQAGKVQLLRPNTVQGRQRSSQHMIAPTQGFGTLKRPQIADIFHHADNRTVAARVGANGARVLRVDIAANIAGFYGIARSRQCCRQRVE